MLKYHKILSQPSQTKAAKYEHYLTLGSHQSTIKIPTILSFSYITLYNDSRLIVNQEKQQVGTTAFAVTLSGSARINEVVYGENQVVVRPKYINQGGNKEAVILYLLIQTGNNVDLAEQTQKFKQEKTCKLSDSLSVQNSIIKKGDSIQLNKRIFLWVKKGKLIINNDQRQKIEQKQCIYSRDGFGQAFAEQQAEIYLFHFLG